MEIENQEKALVRIMHAGFNKAAVSFSKFTQSSVEIVEAQSRVLRQSSDLASITDENGDVFVLTTQIIGYISGKSYLIFSKDEVREILKAINLTSSNEALHEAFLMEIDNIISAAVIAELSNRLGIEIYGDVPHIVKLHASGLSEFFKSEFKKSSSSSIILSNTSFRFDGKENVHPQFIWQIGSKIFELIQEQNIPA